MTHTKDEALKLALEVFSVIAVADNLDWIRHQAAQQATTIKQALAAPTVQEPALVIYQGEIAKSNLPKGFTGMLYTIPPAAPVPLTDEQMAKALPRPWPDEGDRVCLSPTELRQFARGIMKGQP
jgi:hypothetical protein